MPKPSKRAKKDNSRSIAQRREQVDIIKKSLLDLQLDDRIPDIQRLYTIMDGYIETGQSASGHYPLEGSNKNIQYILSNKQHIKCVVNLLVRQ